MDTMLEGGEEGTDILVVQTGALIL